MSVSEPIWRKYQRRVDSNVDLTFSERVEFYPWTGGESVADDLVADPSRVILKTVGVYVTPGARAMGESGTLASGLATSIQTGREWISISEENFGDPSLWRAYDRVHLPDQLPNQQWHSIEKIQPAATKRYNVYLIRLQQGSDEPGVEP
jgi:hypothetical protein